MPAMSPRVLLVTDLTYPARGRRYCDEDIWLSSALREHVTLSLCHPLDAEALLESADVVLVRNTGPVIGYLDAYASFRRRALDLGVRVLPELTGRADQVGKDYLPDLFAAGLPVIPTVARIEDVGLLPITSSYVVKPRLGADSVGLRFVDRDELPRVDLADMLVQPAIDFAHEVSFVFVGRAFRYALHAPDPQARWALEPFEPTPEDLAFAQRFVDWNGIDHGIQRVDACRTRDGALLLMELEDWNPYLSLDLVSEQQRTDLVAALVRSIRTVTGE